MNFYANVSIAAAVVLAAALGLLFFLSGGEEAAIEKILERGAEAAGEGDVDALIAMISPRYKSVLDDYEGVVRRLRQELSRFRGSRFSVKGAAIRVDGEKAEARTRVKVSAGQHRMGDLIIRIAFEKEGGAWKIVSGEEIR